MPSDFPDLPKDPKALSKVINKHMAREDIIMLYKRTMWLVAFYYLNGARSFSHYDPSTQSVRPLWVDDNGNAEFMSQELLAEINEEGHEEAVLTLTDEDVKDGVVDFEARIESLRRKPA